MGPSFLRSRPLQVDILTAFVGLLLVTVLLIVGYTYHENTKAVMEISDDLIDQVTQRVINQTAEYLEPASIMAEVCARIAGEDRFAILENKRIGSVAMEVIRAYPQLAMCNIADERGNFLMHKKMPDGTISTKVINRNITPPTVTWIHRNREGEIVKEEKSTDVQYDPRVRPWFQGAKKAQGIYWTDIYIFFTDRLPGITASYPVRDAQGKIVGVLGFDIELIEISKFLKSLKIGKSGTGFIVNAKQELVAYPDLTQIVKKEGEGFRPAQIHEVNKRCIAQCYSDYAKTQRNKFLFSAAGKRYIASVTPFPASFGKVWKMGVVVPQDDFIGALKRANRVSILIAFFVLIAAIVSATLLSRSISKPISALARETKRIKDFDLGEGASVTTRIKEIQSMSDAIAAMRTGLKAFRRYVPASLVRQLIQTGREARLGGELKELTILFTDVKGFTSLMEEIDPQELLIHYSEYLDELTKIIMVEQGTIDKYTGDGIMAFWGAPVADQEHAVHACRAALLCKAKVARLNARWQEEGKVPLPTRIGIHTGESVVGNMGSTERMNYSVLGDSVNLASRLEGVNKIYGTVIIVSESTRQKAGDEFLFRPLDVVAVKGKKQGIRIYELVAKRDGEDAVEAKELCDRFAEGFDAYLKREWDEAAAVFRDLLGKLPSDPPTKLYVERCTAFQKAPPGPDWDGIVYLDQK
ncbi:MAG: hypothetical protein GXP25_12605 [Planctomycetes bacterium]|nr:hypothetical protein [Planctomycetota bacterium]